MRVFTSPRFWIGIAISLLCLWLAFRDVPFSELGRSLALANYLLLLPAIALQLLSIIARAQRWVVLLGKQDRLADSFWAQSIGYLFTNVLPFRLGEPARVIVMAERCQMPVVQVATAAVIERLLDVATILLFLILVLPFMQVPPIVTQAGLTFGVLIVLAPFILVLLVRFERLGASLLQSICRWCKFLPGESIVARWAELVEGLRPLMNWRIAVGSVGWSISTWVLSVGSEWMALRMFEPDGTIVEAAFVIVALALAVTVPSSPGFIGVYQFIGLQALVLPFGTKYDPATALAITLTAYMVYYVGTTSLGVVALWRMGESFSRLGQLVAGRNLKVPQSRKD